MPEVSTERFRLLTEVCLTAIAEGRLALAEPVAEALEAARPGEEATFVVRILLDICRQNPQQALKIAEEGIRLHPDSERLGVFRALALMAGGYTSQAEAALEPLAGGGADSVTAALARALLQHDGRTHSDRKDGS